MKSKIFTIALILSFGFIIAQETKNSNTNFLLNNSFNSSKYELNRFIDLENSIDEKSKYLFSENKFGLLQNPEVVSIFKNSKKNEQKIVPLKVLINQALVDEILKSELKNFYSTFRNEQKNEYDLKENILRNRLLRTISFPNSTLQIGEEIKEKSNYLTTLDEVLLRHSLNLLALNLN